MVAGFDNVEFAAQATPPLTTNLPRMHAVYMGRSAPRDLAGHQRLGRGPELTWTTRDWSEKQQLI
ncbi:MAG: hypothetical protein AAF566_04905 [Pseudomonadota bacterium]